MKISFKLLIFCLIAAFLVISYHVEIKAQIQTPTAGSSYTIGQLYALINTNNPQKSSNFIITPDGKNSYGASKYGFTSVWAQNNATVVTLQSDPAQIANLINNGVLPTLAQVNALKNYPAAYKAALALYNNFPNILLYFTAVSPTNGKPFKLYIVDPCPGKTNWTLIRRLPQPQSHIPAYTNVLSKWNTGN